MNKEQKYFKIGSIFLYLALAFFSVIPAVLQFNNLARYIKYTNWLLWISLFFTFVFYFCSPDFVKKQLKYIGIAVIIYAFFDAGVSLYMLGVIYLKTLISLLMGVFFMFIVK